MTQVKTSELSGAALDWAVAKCESTDGRIIKLGGGWNGSFYIERENGPDCGGFHRYATSTDWSQGGPIIEREGIAIDVNIVGYWQGKVTRGHGFFSELGQSPLVAAMRCYVASRLGDVVEIPDEIA